MACTIFFVLGNHIGIWAPSDLGGGNFLAQKIYAMPKRVRVEIGMQTLMFTTLASNETAIIGKTACILNSVNSLNVILNVLKKKFFLPWCCPKMSIILSILPHGVRKVSLQPPESAERMFH